MSKRYHAVAEAPPGALEPSRHGRLRNLEEGRELSLREPLPVLELDEDLVVEGELAEGGGDSAHCTFCRFRAVCVKK